MHIVSVYSIIVNLMWWISREESVWFPSRLMWCEEAESHLGPSDHLYDMCVCRKYVFTQTNIVLGHTGYLLSSQTNYGICEPDNHDIRKLKLCLSDATQTILIWQMDFAIIFI